MTQEQNDGKIDYIEFSVNDMEAAKQFYRAVFGWEYTDFGPEYASFTDGRVTGGFRSDQGPGEGGPLVVMYALNLEAMEKSVRDHGGVITQGIFKFPGGRRFEFKDPGGNNLAVWSDA